MENELPKRKKMRLKNFDYNSNGMYFVTICTQNMKYVFGTIVGVGVTRTHLRKFYCKQSEMIEL